MRLRHTYKVHLFDADMGVSEGRLQPLLNDLRGDVIGIEPQHREDSPEEIESLLVVERVVWQPWRSSTAGLS
jgi:hypothetical protein